MILNNRARIRGSSIVLMALLLAACDVPAAQDGVIFMYHHVDAATPRSTSISPDEFAAQLAYLEREEFHVLPLLELIESLQSGETLPERSVAITFDDGYDSVLTAALPELSARGWPFTVFVNTQAIDEAYSGYLSWDDLRELGANGATIGNHSVSHAHLVRRLDGENAAAWNRRVSGEIRVANERLRAEVGDYLIPVFAYPYGEYTSELESIVRAQGLFGLGQQSGAVGATSDFLALPRYPIASSLDLSAEDFALRAHSRALPVRVSGPEQHVVARDPRPSVELEIVSDDDLRLGELACYASGQGRMNVEWDGASMRKFRAVPLEPLGPGRSKYNCTAPSRSVNGVYYWYAYLWMKQREDGSWYDE
jgi:peptidoglycan/xylan/chitin deacetylase (PgdA/CDA1 family)